MLEPQRGFLPAPLRPTRLMRALAARLDGRAEPVITDYALFLELRTLYRNRRGLYVRGAVPSLVDHRRTRRLLLRENIIADDHDYPRVYGLIAKHDLDADEIACLVDPFCYIGHISALQRYGLTDRRPEALHLTVPGPRVARGLVDRRMREDYGEELGTLDREQILPLTAVHHPERVRRRKVETFATVHPGAWLRVRGSFARIATVGQTFLDTLDAPDRCGGMLHVLDTWRAHARTYLEEIVAAVDGAPKPIHKVRAGYILAELMGVDDPRVAAWKAFAKRGGSRVLDPGRPFVAAHSEDWMLSLNAA